MLGEEALILGGVLIACGLFLLGVMELLWPTRAPRSALRRPDLARPRVIGVHSAAPTRCSLEPARSRYGGQLTVPIQLSLPDEAMAARVALAERAGDIGEAPAVVAPPEPAYASILEECTDLYQQRRYADVVALGTGAFGEDGDGRGPRDVGESAALWRVVALAHRGLGEDVESRAAIEAARAVAPEAERPRYERELVTLAGTAAHDLLAETERLTNAQAEARLTLVREAVAWLESARSVAPADTGLEERIGAARASLWPAYERAALRLVHRQEFRGARRLLREAVNNPHFPVARTDVFRELFTGTFSGEIGQLTAKAIRSMHAARESDALAALQRAETLLDNLGDDMLSPSRRVEVDGRFWWGYNRLGERRVAAGEYEIALDPLFHALEYDAGPARHEETRALLVRALEGVADVRALAIRELAAAGEREAAVRQCNTLWTTLRTAAESGLSQHELASAFSRAQRVFDSLERARER
jgi:tetratricopeptide (TPR) repeat protein